MLKRIFYISFLGLIIFGTFLFFVHTVNKLFFPQSNNPNSYQANSSKPSRDSGYLTNNSPKEESIAPTPSYEITNEYISDIPNAGSVPKDKKVFIYETIKRLGTQCSSNDSISSYYISSLDGDYNRRLFSFHNNAKSYATLSYTLNSIRNGFDVRVSIWPDQRKYFVDFSGNREDVAPSEEGDQKKSPDFETKSPNGKYIAKVLNYEISSDKVIYIEIINILSNKKKVLQFEKNLNGVYVDSWAPDSKAVYIAGGMWEFSAPAKLWRYDLDTEKLISYDSLKSMVYPIAIFPDRNIAFVRDKGTFDFNNEGANGKSSLYSINLKTGGLKKVVTEIGAIGTLSNIHAGTIYYHVYKNIDTPDQTSDVKSLDVSQLKVKDFLNDISITYPRFDSSISSFKKLESDFFSFQKGDALYVSTFNRPDIQRVLGEKFPGDCKEIVPEKEYTREVLSSSF